MIISWMDGLKSSLDINLLYGKIQAMYKQMQSVHKVFGLDPGEKLLLLHSTGWSFDCFHLLNS